MKTRTQFFTLMIAMFIIGFAAAQASAQGRGHHKDDKRRVSNQERRDYHRDGYHKHADHKHVHKHGRHPDRVRYASHLHDRHCRHTPVVVHHYPKRPRYIYYRDYDVYYDTDRSVYISWSGSQWSVSASVPVVLRRVERHRAVRMEVDYYQDDFAGYLASGRPVYRSVYSEF